MSQRHRPSRRTVLQTIGSLGAVPIAASTIGGAETDDDIGGAVDGSIRPTAGSPDGATRYVAVVDRIVDGRHVVLLLEDDGELVDQHVEPRSSFDDVDEGDILLVVIDDSELLAYQHLPKRPGRNTTDQPCGRLESLHTDGGPS